MKRHCYNCGGRGWITPEFNRRFSPHPEANDHPSNPRKG